jgi:serine/threonine protein phosphatase PrpC
LVPNIGLALKNSFISCNEELPKHVQDPSFSGTTCCTLLLNGARMYCANAGDSRCVVVGKNGRVK